MMLYSVLVACNTHPGGGHIRALGALDDSFMRLEKLPWLSVVPRDVPILKDGVYLGLIIQYAPNLSSPTPHGYFVHATVRWRLAAAGFFGMVSMSKFVFEAAELTLDEKLISVMVSVVLGYPVNDKGSVQHGGMIYVKLMSGSLGAHAVPDKFLRHQIPADREWSCALSG